MSFSRYYQTLREIMQAANTLEDLIERKAGRHDCCHRLSYKAKDGRLVPHRYNHRSMEHLPPDERGHQ